LRFALHDQGSLRASTRIIVLMLFGLGCGARPRRGLPEPRAGDREGEHAGFISRLGVDTIIVESFSASRGVTEGDIIDRSPETSWVHYAFTVDSGGRITSFAAAPRAVAAGAPPTPYWSVSVERVRGGFDVVDREGDSTRRGFVPASADAVPLWRAIALYELVTARLRRAGGDSIALPMIELDPPRVRESAIRRLGADSVVIPLIFPRGERARVDPAGRILGVSGMATSYKWLTERVADLDVSALARSFAERDARGAAFGNYSSRDTARAVIDGGHIAIDYGRPSTRGRVVFGGLVPWGEVWRTGADLATHLTTDRDLRVGELLVPAGTYTLYTVPSPARWTLIVNRKTGQNGLLYDSAADLGRVDVVEGQLHAVVHVEAALRLPDQAQVGVVHQHVDVGRRRRAQDSVGQPDG